MRTTVPVIRTFVLIITFFFCSSSFSQSYSATTGIYEVGANVGPIFFLGDLGGNYGVGTKFIKDVNLPTTKLTKGIYASVHPTEWLGFRVALNQGALTGSDSLIKGRGGDEEYRKVRNLNFRSNLWEAYGVVELYPTVFLEQYDGLQGQIRPYGVLGIGIFHFNPQALYYNSAGKSSWVNVHDLRLEGQGMDEYPDRKEYKLTQWEIPMGVGIKYYVKENFYLGFEILHRKTFTDYIDDVSTTYIDANLFEKYLTPAQAKMARQLYYRENFVPTGALNRMPTDPQRGNPKLNDSYFSSVLRFGWRLSDGNSPASRAARQLRCPTFY